MRSIDGREDIPLPNQNRFRGSFLFKTCLALAGATGCWASSIPWSIRLEAYWIDPGIFIGCLAGVMIYRKRRPVAG
jgi:hypothetical protein